MATITDYFPNGYDDLKTAGCEEPGCNGDAVVFYVYSDEDGDSEILCGRCRSDRQASGKAEEAVHKFTLDD